MPGVPRVHPDLPSAYPGIREALEANRTLFVEWRYLHERPRALAETSVLSRVAVRGGRATVRECGEGRMPGWSGRQGDGAACRNGLGAMAGQSSKGPEVGDWSLAKSAPAQHGSGSWCGERTARTVSGTGFMHKFCEVGDEAIQCVGTNRHVIAESVSCELVFRSQRVEAADAPVVASTIRFDEGFEERWYKHPDERVDLAALPVSNEFRQMLGKRIHPVVQGDAAVATRDGGGSRAAQCGRGDPDGGVSGRAVGRGEQPAGRAQGHHGVAGVGGVEREKRVPDRLFGVSGFQRFARLPVQSVGHETVGGAQADPDQSGDAAGRGEVGLRPHGRRRGGGEPCAHGEREVGDCDSERPRSVHKGGRAALLRAAFSEGHGGRGAGRIAAPCPWCRGLLDDKRGRFLAGRAERGHGRQGALRRKTMKFSFLSWFVSFLAERIAMLPQVNDSYPGSTARTNQRITPHG